MGDEWRPGFRRLVLGYVRSRNIGLTHLLRGTEPRVWGRSVLRGRSLLKFSM
jgi:hypothetical protein